MSDSSPRLLVSVRSVEEAHAALAGGADILDVKEPSNGSLGRADLATIDAILAEPRVRETMMVTAAWGDLGDDGDAVDVDDRVPAGLAFVKVGFAGEPNRLDWRRRFARLRESLGVQTPLIPAAYADAERAEAPDVEEIADLAIDLQTPYLLIDTHAKDGRGLWSWLDDCRLARLAERCVGAGVGLAVAGSLRAEDFDRLAPLPIAVLAVRGAACRGADRNGSVDGERVRELKVRLASGAPRPC